MPAVRETLGEFKRWGLPVDRAVLNILLSAHASSSDQQGALAAFDSFAAQHGNSPILTTNPLAHDLMINVAIGVLGGT